MLREIHETNKLKKAQENNPSIKNASLAAEPQNMADMTVMYKPGENLDDSLSNKSGENNIKNVPEEEKQPQDKHIERKRNDSVDSNGQKSQNSDDETRRPRHKPKTIVRPSSQDAANRNQNGFLRMFCGCGRTA